jgi:hypothetical protein
LSYPLEGFPPRPPPDLFPVLEGHPALFGLMGGCPLCFDMAITSFCFFEGNGSARFRNVNQHFKLAA